MTDAAADQSHLTLDPRVTLATSLATQKGTYALLLGSGVSTGAGIPTGWGVVEALVRRVAAAEGDTLESSADWEGWWAQHHDGDLGYSSLLAQLASTAPARRALLAGFFEPTPENLEQEQKVPGPAHKAIAALVARGVIRVVVTTNFDRLLEHALAAEGVMAQVISTDSDVAGMEPLQHARATIIKLNGDFTSLDQRNTVDELSQYPEATTALLSRVLDEYGLIVSGWSGDWDTALVSAVKASANRRYPLYWAARGAVIGTAGEITARSGSHLIQNVTADDFFPDLLARLDAVEQMIEPPASRAMKLAQLRRALPDPVRHLEVRALFEQEIASLRNWARERPNSPTDYSPEAIDADFIRIEEHTRTLVELYSMGILLDRDRQHDDLWVWVLQQALNVRTLPSGASVDWWDNLAHYPAFLLLRSGIMAALAADHEEVAVRILGKPRWSSILVQSARELPAHQVLHLRQVFDQDVLKLLPRLSGRWLYPASKFIRDRLRDLGDQLVGGGPATEQLLNRMEYRAALASHLLPRSAGEYFNGAAGGEFLLTESIWARDESEHIAATSDFLANGDKAAWGWTASKPETFDASIAAIDEQLRKITQET